MVSLPGFRLGLRRYRLVSGGMAMIGAYRDLEGCLQLLWHVLRRLKVLKLPPMAEQLTRQIYFSGVSATARIVTRSAFIGTLIVVYVIEILEADAALAVKILLWVVLREMGPLFAALLVLQRSGTAIATELALMQVTGEVASLRRMRVDPYDYLVVPRVVGVAVSTAVLTFYVQVIAVGGGMLLSAMVVNATFDQLAESFFRLASPMDIAYSLIKSLLFGVSIAVIACYHGLHPSGGSINAIPKAAIRAITQSTLVVMLLNVVFAYLVFGVLWLGVVTAEL